MQWFSRRVLLATPLVVCAAHMDAGDAADADAVVPSCLGYSLRGALSLPGQGHGKP